MRNVAMLMIVLALVPLGCKKKTAPVATKKPTVLPAGSKPIARLPEVGPVTPVPKPRPIPPVKPMPKPVDPAGANVYVVKKGDTLWSIAKRLLGDGQRHREIKALNNLTSDNIEIGQKLRIPGK